MIAAQSKRLVALTLIALVSTPAWAKKAPDDDSSDDSGDDDKPKKKKADDKADKDKDKDDSSDDSSSSSDDSDSDEKPKKKKTENSDFQKQDLSGHDLGTEKKENLFEKDRFFVDKVDSPKTEKGTLIQGSLASTSFLYTESSDKFMGGTTGTAASDFSRMFTELRLQSDFRHINGGQWDGRVDVRGRVVDQPTQNTPPINSTLEATPTQIQSGLTGGDELEIRELWLVRNGKQSDVFIGRQFIQDLAGVKIDGIRIDYASSSKFTLLGFAGLFPLRGSRSITTDYIPLNFIDADGNRQSEGRFVGTAGGGAAYRTVAAYGAFGGVVQAPFGGEQPRIFGTSNGYWRYGSTLDFYHFAVVDLVGSNTAANGIISSGLTNLSVGVNYKPSPRLRITGSFNQVDAETLNVQAGAFLNSAGTTNPIIDNEVYIQRLATSEARGSVSAGLGQLQRFEITTSLAFRYRPDVTLTSIGVAPVTTATLKAEEGAEFYVGVTDRRSIKGFRLGADFLQTFGVGSATYAHTNLYSLRGYASRELANGHGEWEAEIAYTQTRDNNAGTMTTCSITALDACTGTASGSLLSIGGSVYYRLNRDWFGLASAYITQQSLVTSSSGVAAPDPSITGLSGFLRVAYRF